eukprot:CAMPEP_0172674142 /NCGR_PEP_ID=MMETSP1074-20121228/12580_1 /TAXON_ID=2916 /ORGANISM="Ceratium fusus, Strain PA161109" /LENGTH=175 /DNA_ID=CAMNT_0013491535 /DNA_START=36 /DNA_END=560 /DNA_ORIENTATION=+
MEQIPVSPVMAAQGSQLQGIAATGHPAPAKFQLLPLQQERPRTSILDGFFETCVDEACGIKEAWEGSKSDVSIYDEKEILKGKELPHAAEQHLSEQSSPQQSGVEWSPQDQHVTAFEYIHMAQMVLNMTSGRYAACEPHALKAVRQACCVYHRMADSKSACPICLEEVLSGQSVW